MEKQKFLSIGELSKLTGIHIKSLRYYDKIGVLKPAFVDPDTGYRYYTFSQLSIVEAIRTCIELDIPLKEFARYTEDGGQKVHYARLLQHGREVAEQKFRVIREGLRYISELQAEIQRNDRFFSGDAPAPVDLPKKRCLVEPLTALPKNDEMHMIFGNLFTKAEERGYKSGYDLGLLYIYRASGKVERYQFIDILSGVKNRVKDVMVIPAGTYLSRHVNSDQIEAAPELFPELFALGQDLTVVESELFTGEYNSAELLYELRCSVPETTGEKTEPLL